MDNCRRVHIFYENARNPTIAIDNAFMRVRGGRERYQAMRASESG